MLNNLFCKDQDGDQTLVSGLKEQESTIDLDHPPWDLTINPGYYCLALWLYNIMVSGNCYFNLVTGFQFTTSLLDLLSQKSSYYLLLYLHSSFFWVFFQYSITWAMLETYNTIIAFLTLSSLILRGTQLS